MKRERAEGESRFIAGGRIESGPPFAARWGWAAWEFGTTPHQILITAYIFAPYFTNVVIGKAEGGPARWALLQIIAGFAAAVIAPVLGAVADRIGPRKPWIAPISIAMALILPWLWFVLPDGKGGLPVWMASTMIVLLAILFEIGVVFHNAMLPSIAGDRCTGTLSGLGTALGSFGACLLLFFMLICFALPGQVEWFFVPDKPLFGLSRADYEPERIAGLLVAGWIVVFTAVFLIWTPDIASSKVRFVTAARTGLGSLAFTLRSARAYRNIVRFLIARMLYIDGQAAILIFSGVYAQYIFDWGITDMLIYGLTVIAFGVLGGLTGGSLDAWLGSKRATLAALAAVMASLVVSLSVTKTHLFFFVPLPPDGGRVSTGLPFLDTVPEIIYLVSCMVVAVSITASITTSRALLARLAPMNRMSEFCGLYAFSGKATAFLAPLIIYGLTTATGSYRIGVASILVFLAAGFLILLSVCEERSPDMHRS